MKPAILAFALGACATAKPAAAPAQWVHVAVVATAGGEKLWPKVCTKV